MVTYDFLSAKQVILSNVGTNINFISFVFSSSLHINGANNYSNVTSTPPSFTFIGIGKMAIILNGGVIRPT